MSGEERVHIRLVPIFAGDPDVALCTKQPEPRLSSVMEDWTCAACLALQSQGLRSARSRS